MNLTNSVSRRAFLQQIGLLGATGLGTSGLIGACNAYAPPSDLPERPGAVVIDDFSRPDAHNVGDAWESLNPGYWHIKGGALRRRLNPESNKRPVDWFPWHWETHRQSAIPLAPDPSLPFGMLWRRDWQLSGNYSIQIHFTIHSLPATNPSAKSLQERPGYSVFGIGFGSHCLHESWSGSQNEEDSSFLKSLIPGNQRREAAWMLLVTDDGRLGIFSHLTDELIPVDDEIEIDIGRLNAGDTGSLTLFVTGEDDQYADVSGLLAIGDEWHTLHLPRVNRTSYTSGYVGLVTRGLIDFEIASVSLDPGDNFSLDTPVNELHVCYPLGDTLRKETDGWHCTFVALCRNAGNRIELRVNDDRSPSEGWSNVAIAGSAEIVSNEFRRNTAIIDVLLPYDPAEREMYYTVWKDGADVTADIRIGTQSVGAGTGFIGKVPSSGRYFGRLPRLTAPYRVCGLSCHSIHENRPDLPDAKKYQAWYVHDQPTPLAFESLEAFEFQIMLWEDDVWYLELMFPPPSTDDSYKVITTTIAGPTTRWQMMRHWNIVNPGDHDFGMDDVKGPEQLILRQRDDLGQNSAYMRRNFQIVQHLMSGDESPDPDVNPRNWRKWRMPHNDFSIYILDARLWRTSQDTHIWDEQGWKNKDNVYDRSNPTRTLLGEEQYSWLEQQLKTDGSPLICISGINGLHTIWGGIRKNPESNLRFDQRDRVTADYAGWVKAGSDRVLNLLGSRTGVTSVYGDVHNGCILVNDDQRIAECIGRESGRAPKEDFAAVMTDYDGRAIHVHALYHADYESPELHPRKGPFYWNFLEMHFDPAASSPATVLALRNVIDSPGMEPRGGGSLNLRAEDTGRPADSFAPSIRLIPDADVQISYLNGNLIRATRTRSDGRMPATGLSGVMPDTTVLVTAYTRERALSQIIQTISSRSR